MKNWIRLLSLSMAVLMLTACTMTRKPTHSAPGAMEVTTAPAQSLPDIPQQEMPAQELSLALANLDLSMLCAGMDLNNRLNQLTQLYYTNVESVAYTDYDSDGLPEVLVAVGDMIFDVSNGHNGDCHMVQSYPIYQTDKDGNIYRVEMMGDTDFLDAPGGGVAYRVYLSTAYSQWKNGQWECVISYYGQVEYPETGSLFALNLENLSDPSNYTAYEMHCEINDRECSMEELWQHTQELELAPVTTQPSEFTENRFNVSYRDSLVNALDQYLRENYGTFNYTYERDIDGDGENEYIFIVPDFDSVWYRNLRTVHSAGHDAGNMYEMLLSREYTRTAILVADTQDEEVVFDAYCAPEYLNYGDASNFQISNSFLWIDQYGIYLNGRMASNVDTPAILQQYLESYGLQDSFFRKVDVTDMTADEYLCVARLDNRWMILLVVIQNGNPQVVYTTSTEESAIYLVEKDGKQYLMEYMQNVFTLSNGTVHTEYSYELLRFDGEGNTVSQELQRMSYNDDQQDATAVAAFFEKLNAYLVKIIVICDPFELTGSQWMTQEQADYGTVPRPQEPTGQDEKPVMGFVSIQDPSSWLNLREGPGTEYPRVLVDPANPESFVRQAQGAPVTVLETIETDDPENPVWLKVRISYAGREIIGYSSKTYIRLMDE